MTGHGLRGTVLPALRYWSTLVLVCLFGLIVLAWIVVCGGGTGPNLSGEISEARLYVPCLPWHLIAGPSFLLGILALRLEVRRHAGSALFVWTWITSLAACLVTTRLLIGQYPAVILPVLAFTVIGSVLAWVTMKRTRSG